MGIGVHIDLADLARALRRVDDIGRYDRDDLLDTVGAVVESQTRRRISEDKSDPDGEDWPAWSRKYARTRHAGHSLLEGEGDLLDSITHVAGADAVVIGSNLIYSGPHQKGDADRNIPARSYLGLSADDREELETEIHDWFEGLTA